MSLYTQIKFNQKKKTCANEIKNLLKMFKKYIFEEQFRELNPKVNKYIFFLSFLKR